MQEEIFGNRGLHLGAKFHQSVERHTLETDSITTLVIDRQGGSEIPTLRQMNRGCIEKFLWLSSAEDTTQPVPNRALGVSPSRFLQEKGVPRTGNKIIESYFNTCRSLRYLAVERIHIARISRPSDSFSRGSDDQARDINDSAIGSMTARQPLGI